MVAFIDKAFEGVIMMVMILALVGVVISSLASALVSANITALQTTLITLMGTIFFLGLGVLVWRHFKPSTS